MKHPRGRWNGKRITGIRITTQWRYDYVMTQPHFRWRHGELVLMILGFRIHIEAAYHFRD